MNNSSKMNNNTSVQSNGIGNPTSRGNGSLSLEELTMEYKMTLMMYNKVQTDYITYLKDVNSLSGYRVLCAGRGGNLWNYGNIIADKRVEHRVPDGGSHITGICVGNDGKTIFACGYNGQLYTKTSWDSLLYTLIPDPNCCVTKIAQGSDGTIVGVGTDNTLWAKMGGISGEWTHVNSTGEWVSAVCIAPDDSVYVIGSYSGGNGYGIYKKPNYKTLSTDSWQHVADQFFIDFTILPNGIMLGVGTDYNLYSYASYKRISSHAKRRVGHGGCCVVSVAGVVNTKYEHFKGKSFWGAESLLDSSANTVKSCKALCSATPKCSGATFNSTNSPNSTCQLQSGDGNFASGKKGDVGLMVEGPGLLKISQQLNSKLTDLNSQIFNLTTNSGSLHNPAGKNNAKKLIMKSHILQKERDKLDQLADEKMKLDVEHDEVDIMISSNYYSFMLLSLLAIIFIICLIVLSMSKSASTAAAPAIAPAPAPAAVQSGGKLNKNVLFYAFFGVAMVALFMFPKHHGFD
jgi:hypothetical protein